MGWLDLKREAASRGKKKKKTSVHSFAYDLASLRHESLGVIGRFTCWPKDSRASVLVKKAEGVLPFVIKL